MRALKSSWAMPPKIDVRLMLFWRFDEGTKKELDTLLRGREKRLQVLLLASH